MKKDTVIKLTGILIACVLWAGVYLYSDGYKSNAGLAKIFRSFHKPSLAVLFLDVGQGDATLIITPEGKTTLIDSGPASLDFGFGWNGAEKSILPSLSALGIHHLDSVIITHNDIDHMGGIFSLIERMKIDCVYYNGHVHPSASYRQFINRIRQRGLHLIALKSADHLTLGRDIHAQVLFPQENVAFDNNDQSLVLRIVYKSMDLLMLGDLERLSEYQLSLRYGEQLRSDVLKIPHHGSKTSSSASFINVVRPKIAICSSGRNNSYGHPVPYILERYNKICSRVFRTDINGHVLLLTDGTIGWVWAQNTKPMHINFNDEVNIAS
ncbi:MAG: ComEC/Rec2 family competence protein [Chlamydiota bacterium]|nr:ComEC/Rec2 family competence protein [Chlamydiota bacterium]